MNKFEYRFAVGTPDLRSSSYTIFTNPNKSDIYVGHRGIVQDMKVSLHESGKNYLGYTSNTKHPIAIQKTAEEGRHIHKWQGFPIHPANYHCHFRIVFPTRELRKLPRDVNNKIINWIEPAPKNHQLEIVIVTGPPGNVKGFYNAPSKFLAEFKLPNGSILWVMAVTQPCKPEAFQKTKASNPPNPDERIIGMLTSDQVPAFVDLAGD